MKKLEVDYYQVDAILSFMEIYDPVYEVYIDLTNGDVVSEETDDLTSDDLENYSDRYHLIESFPSWQGFKVMESFIEEIVVDEKLAERLHDVLSRKRPFRRFKDALTPELLSRYSDYKSEILLKHLKAELADRDYELVVGEKQSPGDSV